MNNSERVAKYSNHLLTLLKLFPNESWNYYEVSRNPNITWDIIFNDPSLLCIKSRWIFPGLTRNPNPLTTGWNIIKNNPNKARDWDSYELSRNPNITWDIVKNNPSPPGEAMGLASII